MSFKINQPQVIPYPAGANDMYSAGQAHTNASIAKSVSLNKMANGGASKKRGGAIQIPNVKAPYPEASAGSQSITGLTASTTALAASSQENAKYDNPKGGRKKNKSRRKRRGGVVWGCMSGGRGKRRKSRKSRK